jgi:hypothetical protein
LFFRRCNFERWVSAAISQAGQVFVQVITDLSSALWRVSSLLALKRSLLSREYTLITALKSLA